MDYYVKSVIPVIESNYENFTALEKNIADFFMKNEDISKRSFKDLISRSVDLNTLFIKLFFSFLMNNKALRNEFANWQKDTFNQQPYSYSTMYNNNYFNNGEL